MTNTNHVRINELARELEVRAKVIIDVLSCFGVGEKKTRSSSIPADVAEKIRGAKELLRRPSAPAAPPAASPKHAAPAAPMPAPAKRSPIPAATESLHTIQGSFEGQLKQPTYEELLARVKQLEAERKAQTNFEVRSRGRRRKRKNRKKRKDKPVRTVSGGLPSLGKRR